MNKYILVMMLSCLCLMARGQTSIEDIDLSWLPKPTTVKNLRFWYDDDAASVKTCVVSGNAYTLDVTSLTDGLHTLHYQVVDENGQTAYISSGVFLKMGVHTDASSSVKSLRFWYDDDAASVKTSVVSGSAYTLDVASLTDGLHTLHYQVVDENGQMAYVSSAVFLKMKSHTDDAPVTASKLVYWFNDETTFQTVAMSGEVQQIDASRLPDGLHTVHYLVQCSDGQLTMAASAVFLRMNIDIETTVASSLRYWFDDQQTVTETEVADGMLLLDASALTDGLHTVHYQVMDNKGTLGAPASAVFLKMNEGNTTQGTTAQSLRYWFDDDASTVRVTSVANGSQTLDVSALPTGLHTLNYQLIDSNGRVSVPVTCIFLKSFDKVLAEGGNRVTKYQYWQNGNTQAIQTVTLDNAANPYTLIALLPVQKEPIQSSQFHFELTDGVPAIYAKNTLHIRLHDAQGYSIDGEKPFVDYSVKQEVTDITLLQSGVRATAAKPAENQIKWYCLEAEPGDSLQFRLDRAATIQLFAPSGEEVHAVSGSESVKWKGLHVRESGTYYLALHDVTAQQGTTVSIDYNHIDKYAVLRQDVTVVGNGGCSTITFEGNGFRDLYAVDLYNAQGDTVTHVYIGHESDATTSVVFDFNDAAHGKYHAKFRFTEGEKVFNNLITVEQARDIELATTVTYPSTFLRGTSTTYTAKITNKGNMTAYNVPIYLYCETPTIDGITHIKLHGLQLSSILEGVNLEHLKPTERQDLELWANQMGDDHYFLRMKKAVNGTNDSVIVRSNYFSLTLAPYQSKLVKFELRANQTPNVWITVPQNLPPFLLRHDSWQSRSNEIRNRASISDWYCCIREKSECMLDRVSYCLNRTSLWGTDAALVLGAAGLVSGQLEVFPVSAGVLAAAQGVGAAGTLTNLISTNSKVYGNVICGDNSSNELDAFANSVYGANKQSVTGTLGNLILDHLDKMSGNSVGTALGEAKHIQESMIAAQQGITYGMNTYLFGEGNQPLGLTQCLAFKELKSDCIPEDPKGGRSTLVISYDPNEIYGYLAESGANAISAEKTDVYYTIQFENDTTFATASAHEIVVTDTLDATKFDLSTFTPTRVKIGDKSAELTGEKNFVTTIDMRPEIYAIAQVEGTFDEQKGIAKWHITSLDPMTMEPTDDVIQGVLPVNYDGKGIGEVSYDISLKSGLAHATEVNNRAGIVFDTNETIMTPTWTNIVDRIAPVSSVKSITVLNDSTAAVAIDAFDNLSGCWRYDVYVQYGEGSAWWKAAENVRIDTTASVKIYEGIVHGFYVVATDSAGNVERKEAAHEYTLNLGTTTTVTAPDAGTNNATVYDLQGRKQDGNMKKKEIYVVTDSEKKKARKVVGN